MTAEAAENQRRMLMFRNHDLNARTLEVARQRGITFAAARRELAQRGAAARQRNQRVQRSSEELFRRRLEREERMGLR